jgi:diadenosine tetraphosphatase ApaH/serine/threonine PP2A family protein phosphatase
LTQENGKSVPTAIFADIHSNLEALRTCLAHARAQGAENFAFVGDLVGYNADPVACLDIVRELHAQGAVVVRGNHDEAALGGLCEDMGFVPREAIYWTRTQLGAAEREFLEGLPFVARQRGCTFVHASAEAPASWPYIISLRQAQECMAASGESITFAGHVHHQTLYYATGGTVRLFEPEPGIAIPVPPRWQWLAIAGSVGQPRDGNAAAAYVLFDEDSRKLHFFRVPYDCESAARKVLAAGLPERLAWRLRRGF